MADKLKPSKKESPKAANKSDKAKFIKRHGAQSKY